MANQITFPLLQTINFGVSTAFNVQIDAIEGIWKQFAYEAESDGEGEVYPRLDQLLGLREWVGDRVAQQLGLTSFTIKNREWESTLEVKRTQIEDDKYGFLGDAARMMAQNAGELPDLLMGQLLKAGNTTACYDNQNFFDPSHPTYDGGGNPATIANYQAGGSPSWYLFDNRQVIKPMILQKRRPFVLTPQFSMTDAKVFYENVFRWGVDGRLNAGYGIWDLAYRSDAPLTGANFAAARLAMMSHHKPNGAPMNIRPTVWVGPSSLIATAKKLFEGDYDIDNTTSVIQANPWKGECRVVENQWLN